MMDLQHGQQFLKKCKINASPGTAFMSNNDNNNYRPGYWIIVRDITNIYCCDYISICIDRYRQISCNYSISTNFCLLSRARVFNLIGEIGQFWLVNEFVGNHGYRYRTISNVTLICLELLHLHISTTVRVCHTSQCVSVARSIIRLWDRPTIFGLSRLRLAAFCRSIFARRYPWECSIRFLWQLVSVSLNCWDIWDRFVGQLN